MSMPATGPPAMALLAPDDGELVRALMALDRLLVSVGLLVLLGGAGFIAVAQLEAAARMTRRLERRAWWLLGAAWCATTIGTLAGLLLYGPFTAGASFGRTLDAVPLDQTLQTRFGGIWGVRVLLLLILALLWVWSEPEVQRMRKGAWMAVGLLAAVLAVTPALSGHSGARPDAAVGVVVGVLHFSAAAVWFGGLILLGACVLPRADVGSLHSVLRFSSAAFTAMVVIVVTGTVQSWRQLGSLQALGETTYGHLLVAKVAAFLLLIAVAGRSRVLVRRRLMAMELVGAAPARPSADADAGSLWLLRRLVLAEVAIAIVVLAVTALLGIATPPRAL